MFEKMELIQLQRVQNRAACLVIQTKTSYRLAQQFKLRLYMYKALTKTAVIYISDELSLYEPRRPEPSPSMLRLYTLLVLDAKMYQTVILQSRGLGYVIAYRLIFAKPHPL